ncbi:PAS domain S-box protein [Nocardioides dongkuii]|uniref:PAS domain S-box protein n=1 Tax=Nocardioides dongkuii TaxID=2760089 RepID=UPI0015F8C5DD|nr:PAS domain S-box protein [Nocardioides dongkuii]
MGALPTIVIVDDAADVRSLVRTRIRLSRRLEVVGEGNDGREAVDLVTRLRPTMLLLDVSMPGADGLQVLPAVRAASPETLVVMYSGFERQGLAERTAELGAAAYLKKSGSLDTLVDELLGVLDGRRPSSPATTTTDPGDSGGRRDPVLEAHLERFREVFEDAAIGMATLTLAGRVVRANRSLASLTGRSIQELVGLDYAELVEDVPDGLDRLLRAVEAGEDVAQVEHAVPGLDLRLLTTLTPVRDVHGVPLYLFLQAQDVTRQRGAEEQLRETERRFRMLVEAVQDYAIFMLDPDGHIASWNVGAERTKGYTAAEIIGQHFRVFYPPEVQEARHPEHELQIALREGHYEEEGWRIRKDGTRFWAHVTITAVRDEDGRHVGFTKVTRDSTERRSADEALRRSEQRFRMLVEAVQDYAIFMLDPDGRIASWNAGAQRSKGYLADEIIGRHFRIFYPVDVQQARHPEHELATALREGHYEEDGWRVRKDGTRFWAHVTITAVHDEAGRHLGFAKVTRDTTERLRAAEQEARAAEALSAANRLLQEAADEQAQFLAITAHELRGPVGVLGMSAETLHRHWSDLVEEERAEFLTSMVDSAAQLNRLLSDLLTTSRLQARSLDLRPEPIQVRQHLTTLAATLRKTHPQAEVVLDGDEDATIFADPGRLTQAVDNLLTNALRHGRSPIRIETRTHEDRVDLVVTDAGTGVVPEMQERLFERFATGDRGGTGLGLHIVRELARAQDGEAAYDEQAQAFVLSLPRARVDASAAGAP